MVAWLAKNVLSEPTGDRLKNQNRTYRVAFTQLRPVKGAHASVDHVLGGALRGKVLRGCCSAGPHWL